MVTTWNSDLFIYAYFIDKLLGGEKRKLVMCAKYVLGNFCLNLRILRSLVFLKYSFRTKNINTYDLIFSLVVVSFVFQYNKPSETVIPESVDGLQENLDVVVSLAERHYYNCDFKMCYKLTSV